MMVRLELILPNNLLNDFQACTRLQYSGKLDIKSSKGYKWTFYYRLGRIVWAGGGVHPYRRFCRLIKQHCPQIDVDKIRLYPQNVSIEHWDYRLLEILFKKQKITREQVIAIVECAIAELLFDLAQEANFTTITCNDGECPALSSDRNQEIILDAPISLTSTDLSLRTTEESWHCWSQTGLARFSPNLAPILRQPKQLQKIVSPAAYENFVKLINGKRTLRDLALKMKQDVLSLSHYLLRYVLVGIIELVEIPDLSLKVSQIKNNLMVQPAKTIAPLIACVDDSRQICKMVEGIITANDMRFLGIQDPIKILPTLIEQKPDLIFLDLIMPITSGYEICCQLRRVPVFANTPIIILTSNDGIFDRVRCKVAGSTDFMSKPIAADKMMAVVHKYLHNLEAIAPVQTIHNLELCYT